MTRRIDTSLVTLALGRNTAARGLQFEALEDRRMLAQRAGRLYRNGRRLEPDQPDHDGHRAERPHLGGAFRTAGSASSKTTSCCRDSRFQLACDGSGERGFQGIALDPHFEHNGYIYVYYTAATIRPALQPQSAQPADGRSDDREHDHSPAARWCCSTCRCSRSCRRTRARSGTWAARFTFCRTRRLRSRSATTSTTASCRTTTRRSARCCASTRTARRATDNPFYNAADTNPPGGSDWNGNAPGDIDWIDYVWASGLRNPFSGDVDPATGRYFVNDVGEGDVGRDQRRDAGRPQLWLADDRGQRSIPATFPNFTNPVLAYNHSEDCAITGGAFYSPGTCSFPRNTTGCTSTRSSAPARSATSIRTIPARCKFVRHRRRVSDEHRGRSGRLAVLHRPRGRGGGGPGHRHRTRFARFSTPPRSRRRSFQPTDRLVSVGYDATFTVSAAGTHAAHVPMAAAQRHRVRRHSRRDGRDAHAGGVSLADDNAQFRVVVTNISARRRATSPYST